MNRKQIISMWCGILAVGWVCFRRIPSSGIFHYDGDWDGFFLWIILIGLVTGGLILTFKDKKKPEGKTRKPVNLKRGFRRITLLSAIVVAVICGVCIVSEVVYERDFVERCERQLEYFKDAAETGKHNISQSDVMRQARLLDKAENTFWAKLSTGQVVVLCVLAGIGGFCGIWAIYGLLRWAIIPIVRWATTGFRIDTQ